MFDPIDSLIQTYAEAFNVPIELARNIIKTESSMNPKAVSKKGAQGLSQMMPITQREMGITNPFDPEQSIKGGLGYYAKMRNEYGPVGALYAYNWGPGNYSQYLSGKKKNIPQETQNYVNKLATYADPEIGNAPMDLQGRAGVMPQIMPVSAPSAPVQEPSAPQQPENTEMEEYDKMALFNPYIQMALGVLAGNTGKNKREAFANAIGGGLRSAQVSQEQLRREKLATLEQQETKAKLDNYTRLKALAEQSRAYAMDKAKQGGPMSSFWEIASQMSPEAAVSFGKMMADQEELQAKKPLWDAQAEYYRKGKDDTLPSSVREAQWYQQAPPEQRAVYDELNKSKAKDPTLTAPSKEWKESIDELIDVDPDLSKGSGYVFGIGQSDDYKRAKAMLYLDSWELARRKGLSPKEAFEEAKKKYIPQNRAITEEEYAKLPSGAEYVAPDGKTYKKK